MDVSAEELDTCLRVLQRIADDPAMMQQHHRFKSLIAKIHKTGKKGERQAARQQRQNDDRALTATTGLVQQHHVPALRDAERPTTARLQRARTCYSCKHLYTAVHHFYHLLCPECAAFNYNKRFQRADLSSRVALITGGRVKIGYHTALRMLRDGARVLVTTRFPRDAAQRFSSEPDAMIWRDRLRIYGLDLRHIPSVESFVRDLQAEEPALDILINNAAQTIKRPQAFYQHLLAGEQQDTTLMPAEVRRLLARPNLCDALLLEQRASDKAQLSSNIYFPPDTFDRDGQQLDTRPHNSWTLPLDQVSTVELLEVQLVNAVAPFILASQLKPLFQRSPFARRFIVNVSAMEGQFSRENKTVFHPHTNMAKAALNMLTRTSATDYARDGIYMNSVDTGWITDENPYGKRLRVQEDYGFFTPLDVTDGMARIYDPIVQGISDPAEPLYGQFLKNYGPVPW